MSLKVNDVVKVIESANVLLTQRVEDIGRYGIVLGIDHPSAGIAGGLVVRIFGTDNGLGHVLPSVVRFLNATQVELT